MKNYKQLICGILIGAVATLSITALAEYVINPNPYPVKVNGQTVQIEGYNINDSTYFKLRDISAVVGGLTVDFKDGAVIIDTATPAPAPTSVPITTPIANTAQPTPNPKLGEALIEYTTSQGMEFTSDGLPIYVLEDGNKYVRAMDMECIYSYEDYGYDIFGGKLFGNGGIKDENVILSNIPTAPNHQGSILVEYYENNIRDIFQNNCK